MSQNFLFESKALSFLVSTLHMGKAGCFPFKSVYSLKLLLFLRKWMVGLHYFSSTRYILELVNSFPFVSEL